MAVDSTHMASVVDTVVDMEVVATEAGTVAGVAWAGNHKVLAVVVATEQDIVIVVDSVDPADSSNDLHEVGTVEVADTMCSAVAIVVVEVIPILDLRCTSLAAAPMVEAIVVVVLVDCS